MSFQPVKFYQTGTYTVGNRLLSPDERSVQASTLRSNSINSGHRAYQGCGEALGARYAIDAAMAESNGQLISVNATGCLEVFCAYRHHHAGGGGAGQCVRSGQERAGDRHGAGDSLCGDGEGGGFARSRNEVRKATHDTIRMARLTKESGMFPVFEAEYGEVTGVLKIRKQVPVEECLRPQRRFAHLFGKPGHPEMVARLQAIADRNIRKYGLLDEEN